VRWLVVAASLALSAWGLNAAEPLVVENQSVEVASFVAGVDPAVTVTPIPMPALVVELPSGVGAPPKLRPVKKMKVAKKESLPPLMLSRTERHQMALLAHKPKASESSLRDFYNDEDNSDPSVEHLTFHRSFHRPKVVDLVDDDEADGAAAIPASVKLRLFMARMKAVEAHAARMAMQDNEPAADLSADVRLRLFIARAKAIAAHEKKFS